MLTVSRLILTLQSYWDAHGCALLQPYDVEVGAGTSHPATFLRAIGPEPRRVGAGLGSLAERYGNHPVHLLPAGRRTGLHASARRNHLRHRAPGDGAAECGKRIRSDLDARPRIATAADLRRYLSSK